MTWLQKTTTRSSTWFKVGIVSLLLFSLAVRFWGLGRFNTLVFDEVYYVKFAHNYLTQTQFFDGHPPLSKYLIALGIWIGNQLPIGQDAINSKAGAAYSTWSYRWLNALTGSFIPLVVSGIAYQLTRRYSYAFLAGLFAALDGIFLVESRYALNNVYLVLFGLMGLWSLLVALNRHQPLGRGAWLAASGVWFGASASIKWNGLWFLLGAYGLWISAWILQWLQSRRPKVSEPIPITSDPIPSETATEPATSINFLQQLTRLKLWQVGLNFAIVPAVFYYLSWLPHLRFNTTDGFWQLQQQILEYHEQVGNGPKIHPYCSNWYSWILMLRPVAYFFQVTDKGAPLPTGDSLETIAPNKVIYDVHAIGNPILWWLSSVAIFLVLAILVEQAIVGWKTRRDPTGLTLHPTGTMALSSTEIGLLLFLAINYLANLLPWVKVTRCIFMYHYMGASVFASLAIAWFVDRWLASPEPRIRITGIAIVLSITLAFLFWLPLYLGLPLSPLEFRLRMWLPTWI